MKQVFPTLAKVLALAVALAVPGAEGGTRVAEFTGADNGETREFEVQAPWILDWRVNSDYRQSMAIEIWLVDGNTGFQKGLVKRLRSPGYGVPLNGVRLFRESGRFRIRVSSTLARWNLRVEELSREEAELYTPR